MSSGINDKRVGEFSRRIKIPREMHEDIKASYAAGGTSYRKLASEYGVDAKTIYLICNEDRAEKQKESNKEYNKTHKPSKEKRAKYMRDHRNYKRALVEAGKIS